MSKIISLKESELRYIIRESVRSVLQETDLTNTQIRNITGITDDDELNAACLAEECDELGSNIIKDLRDKYGFKRFYDKDTVLDFDFLKKLLKEKYHMNYLGFNESDGGHSFGNDKFVVDLWTLEGYPRLAKFHPKNLLVSTI